MNIMHKTYNPTSGYCFIKCNNYLTKKDFFAEILTFIRTEQRRFNVMTSARLQPFCRYKIISTSVVLMERE